MSQQPTYEALEQKIKLIEDQLVKAKSELNALLNNQVELAAILAKTPLFMMIVDQERRVRKVSDTIVKFSGKKEEEILGLRGGEALRCAYHIDDPKGCGFGTACEVCTVRISVLDTLETGNNHQKVEAKLPFIDDKIKERTLLVSTTLLDLPEKRVLVFIEDITERKQAEEEKEKLIYDLKKALAEVKQLRGILPLCSFCNKIRDDKGYWEKVDVYIRKHSKADISHSVCPKCAKEHYPYLDL